MSDKPSLVNGETVLTASLMQPLYDMVWDALGETPSGASVRAAIAAQGLAPTPSGAEVYVGSAGAWTQLTAALTPAKAHNDATDRDASDAHPISAVTGLQAALDAKASLTYLDAMWPVGSVWFCTASTDPNSLLPGTWTLLSEGQFLVSAGGAGDYTLGSTGGEETHQLTTDEMPSHNHVLNARADAAATGGGSRAVSSATALITLTDSAQNTGGDLPHENRPPFLAINMWERTA